MEIRGGKDDDPTPVPGGSFPLDVNSPEGQFHTISHELEEALWRLLLRPTASVLHVLQLGAVIELMPNVYIQVVRLTHRQPHDRYLRLWCVVPTGTGDEVEERTLLCFYTPGFPDPQFTQLRAGMDLNLAWWGALRTRLDELAVELAIQPEVQAPNGDPLTALGPPAGATAHASPGRQPPTPLEARQLEQVTRQATVLFEEMKRTRDEAYARRDELERQLKDLYFTRYPFMLPAVKHASELSLADLIATWVQRGCPAPELAELEAFNGVRKPDALAPASAQPVPPPAPETAQPWPLAVELERIQALIQERTRLLERLCELSGGHLPLPRRDPATGRLHTLCERCDAQLAARVPEESDAWNIR